jgi:hypothetical protein
MDSTDSVASTASNNVHDIFILQGYDVMGLRTVAGRGSDVMKFLRLRDLEQIHASQEKKIYVKT